MLCLLQILTARAAAASRLLSATLASKALAPFSNLSAQELCNAAVCGSGASVLATGSLTILREQRRSTKRKKNAAHDVEWDKVPDSQKRALAEEIAETRGILGAPTHLLN